MELRNFADHHCKLHTLLPHKIGLLCFFRNIFYLRSNAQTSPTIDIFSFHLKVSFRFYRAMLCKRDLCCHVVSVCLYVCLSVCLSVRPSVTFVDHVKTNKRIVTFFPLCGSSIILVFQYQTGCRYSNENPVTGASNARACEKNSAFQPFFTNISLYLRNGCS